MKPVDPGEAVKKAKAAVDGLEEPYKMEAFKLILQRLISSPQMAAEKPVDENPVKDRRRTPSKRPNRSSDASKAKPKSTLDLSVDELGSLKTYYESYVVKGSELCAFVLAAFLRSKKKMERFTESDIQYCYQQLISLKVQVPVVKDFYLPLVWLVAPSRKKGWLRKATEHEFEFTNAGLIALNSLPKSEAARKAA